MQNLPRIRNSGPYKNRAWSRLHQLKSHTLPTTPMPRQTHELPSPIRDSQLSTSNTPQKLTSATDKGKIAHFSTKVKEDNERNNPYSSFRKLERKGYKH